MTALQKNSRRHHNQKSNSSRKSYMIMHADKKVVCVHPDGSCVFYSKKFMPYNLYLEDVVDADIDTRMQNLDNFYHWCASRVLTLDREFAKEILNSIGASQATTDRERARIALSYHCLSLMDVYWTRELREAVTFDDMNLFENHLSDSFVDVALRGKQMTVLNRHLIADDLGTQGCFPKAWIRKKDEFRLLKDGGADPVERELLASKICRCFRVNQVFYEEEIYDGEIVSAGKIITSKEYSIVTREHFEIYAVNHDMEALDFILQLDGYPYYMMNILDYLVGNTDRHWGNWGLLVDNLSNQPLRLYDLMDFNRAFYSYETLDGGRCLTNPHYANQKEAAVDAVRKIGLNQIQEIDEKWFVKEDRKSVV